MRYTDMNEYGCPLRDQSGEAAINNFTSILDQLPANLRDAFEAEREKRQAEYNTYVADHGYRT